MGKELILEIGTEEIPAGFMNDAISSLASIATRKLGESAVPFEAAEAFGTPRRLVLRITGLAEKQEDRSVESYGPPVRIAFDADGNPTKATLGFAKSQGVDVRKLVRVSRDKGELLAVIRQVKGQKTDAILKQLLPEIITSIPFRKSMKWGDGDVTFARPIRWILAVCGGKTISFTIGDVKSGNKSRGHRFMSPKPFKAAGWEDYSRGLEEGFVVLDQEKRKDAIRGDVRKLAESIGGTVEDDPELLETVNYLVEYPVVLKGDFEKDFLELPKEVLISVMKNHQKYFAVFSKAEPEKLLPHFIFVSGTRVKDGSVVSKGNERVIRARFTDARFFYDEDRNAGLESRLEKLRGMVFLSEIGSYYDKTERLKELAGVIAESAGHEEAAADAVRAAELSKADLATQMVFEFPELQGIMGKYYARLAGEREEVAAAIEEQYMPTSRAGDLPETAVGSILSIADKADTISACFMAGLVPTGASDPYALRRQAIGIINIALEKGFALDPEALFRAGIKAIESRAGGKFAGREEETLGGIMDFVRERFRNLMIADGFPQDVVDAVLGAGFGDVVETKKKIEALAEFRSAPDFESLGIAFKRVVNIVKGQQAGEVSEALFAEPVEKELFSSFESARSGAGERIAERDYKGALAVMKNLKEPVDRFFDNVMVMDKNEDLKRNRLSMLGEIRELFFTIADFSKLST